MKIAKKITIPIQIRNRKFASNLNLISDIVSAYDGMTIDVTFSKRSNKRSNRQNSYYWGCLLPIFQSAIKDSWGELWSIEQMHEFLKTNCNFEELVNEDTGQIIRRIKSTTENSTVSQEEFHKKCRDLCREFFNVEIPLPNEEIKISIF